MESKSFLLIELLASFSELEMEGFKQLLACAYFNTDQRVLKLLKLLEKDLLKGKPFDAIAQAQAYHRLVGHKGKAGNLGELDEKQTKYLRAKMSTLMQSAQRFLTITAIEENPAQEIVLRNKKLLEKKQFRLFERLMKKEEKRVKEKEESIEKYELAYQLENAQLDYLYRSGTLTEKDNFPELLFNLDSYYLLTKLNLQMAMLSIVNVTGKVYDFASFHNIAPFLKTPTYKHHSLVIIYNTLIQLMTTNEEKYNHKLLKVLNDYEIVIPKKYQSDFYFVAGNYYLLQIKKGVIAYNQKLLDLYKIMHEKELLMPDGYLQINLLKNIVAASCKQGDFKWAEEVVNKYHLFARKEVQKSVYHLNMGGIEFYKANYGEARNHFSTISEEAKVNLFFDLDYKILLAKCYYETDAAYLEYTKRYFLSIEKYVRDNKRMPASTIESYKNFIQILINLYRFRHKEGKKTLESIASKVEEMEFLSNKIWLLEKIEELKK